MTKRYNLQILLSDDQDTFTPEQLQIGYDFRLKPIKAENGDWIKYKDYKKEIKKLKDQITDIENERDFAYEQLY